MERDRYISPFTAFGFNRLFGEEASKEPLLDFLRELLRKEEGRIKEITYLKNEHLSLMGDRRPVFDICCENERGEKFIVELQKVKYNFFRDRNEFYSTFPIWEQISKEKWDFELKTVYAVGILDFVFDDADRDKTVVSEIRFMDTEKKAVFYDNLMFIYLQMPNFAKTEDELETHIDKWLYAIRNLPDLHECPEKLGERVFEKFFEIAEIERLTYKEHDAYEYNLKYYRDFKNCIDTARAEGEAKGMMKIAIEKGKKEGKKESARGFLSLGTMTPEQIAQGTGLDIEEVRLLARKRF